MMLSAELLGDLAAERTRYLLDEADRARLVKQIKAKLREQDIASVQIRPIRSTDGEILREGFARLSPTSRWLRFLAPKRELTADEVRYFTDIDHDRHEALIAVHRGDGRGLGVARYIRDKDAPEKAELAITVADEWQGSGLGTELLAQLTVRAVSRGICRFTALISEENTAARRMLQRMSRQVRLVDSSHGAQSYEIALQPCGCG
jgi:RimJ/RimL family protein N-acetyltransferase